MAIISNLCSILWDKIIFFWVCIYFLFFILTFKKNPQLEVKDHIKGHNSALKTAFNSFLSSIGIGSIFLPMTAIIKGGPGTIIWIIIGFIICGAIKYSEVFLSIKYRKKKNNMIMGGVLYLLKKNFRILYICFIIFFILGSVDLIQYHILWNSINIIFPLKSYWNILLILTLVIPLTSDLSTLFKIGSLLLIPIGFGYIYILLFCFLKYPTNIGQLISYSFFYDDWTKQIFLGISTAVYAGGIGLGADSLIECDSTETNPYIQSKLAVQSLFWTGIISVLSSLIIILCGSAQNITETNIIFCLPKKLFAIICICSGFLSISTCMSLGLKIWSLCVSTNIWSKRLLKSFYIFILYYSCYFSSHILSDFLLLILGLLFVINMVVLSWILATSRYQ